MRKLYAFLIMIMFVLSILSASQIKAEVSAGNDLSIDSGIDEKTDSEVITSVTATAGAGLTTDNCLDKMKARFPNVAASRLTKVCNAYQNAKENIEAAANEVRNEIRNDTSKPNTSDKEKKDFPLTMTANRQRVCVDYLTKNQLSDNPLEECRKIMDSSVNCVQFLKNNGIEDAEVKCEKVRAAKEIIKDRIFLKGNVSEKLAEWKLKAIDRIVKEKPNVKAFLENLPEEKVKLYANLPDSIKERIAEMDPSEAQDELKKYNLTIVDKDKLFKVRTILKEKLLSAKEKYEAAKIKYVEAKDKYLDSKNKFLDLKISAQNCEGVNTDECNQARAQIMEEARGYVINSADMLIEHLTKLKEKINSNENIPDNEAQASIKDIDKAIQELNDAKQMAKDATTKDKIIEAAKNVDQVWKEFIAKERFYAARIINSKVEEIFKRSEQLEKKLDATLAKMEEQGIDVSAIQPKVDEFGGYVDDARQKMAQARELFNKAWELRTGTPSTEESAQIEKLVEDAKKLVKDSYKDLKDAYDLLKDILKMIKDAKGEVVKDSEVDSDSGLKPSQAYQIEEINSPPALPGESA